MDIEGREHGVYIPNLDSHSNSNRLPTAICTGPSHFFQQRREVAD